MNLSAAWRPGFLPSPPAGAVNGAWQADQRHAWTATVLLWMLLWLMTVPDGFDYHALSAVAPNSGSGSSRFMWLSLLAAPLLLIAWRHRLAWLLLRWINPFLLLFVALAVASVVWSAFPSFTARRTIRVLAVLFVAFAFVLIGWHQRRFQHGLRPALTTILAGSILFGLLRPDLAIHQETSAELIGAWRGLTNQKNTLGDAASIGMILWLHALLTGDARRWFALAGGAVALTCLVLSRSSTAMLATITASSAMLLMLLAPPRWRHWLRLAVIFGVVGIVVFSLVVLDLLPGTGILLKPVTMLTGKDMTFSGRTDIWAIVVNHIKLHPMLGTGYGAYWVGPMPWSPAYEHELKLHFYPGSAHNGYLEIINDLGVVGLAVALGYLCILLRDAMRLYGLQPAQGALIVALFFQQAVVNLSEAHWFSVLSLDFPIMTLATASVARALLDTRLREYFGHPETPPEPLHVTVRSIA